MNARAGLPAVGELAAVLDSLPQAVLVVSPDYQVSYANAAAEDIFRISSTQIARYGLEGILPASSPVLEVVDQMFSRQAPVNEYQIDISTPRTGEECIVDAYATMLGRNESLGVLLVRERGMAERIDRQLTHRTAARSVTGLASMLAHEIKNPLSGIRGAAQLLEETLKPEDRELTELIRTETDRVVKILDQFEAFGDETPIQIEPVNMHLVLGQVRRIAHAGFGKDVRFVESYDPSLPPVPGSHDELVQAFLNLVKNACEALENTKNPRITLTSAYRPGIRITVPGEAKPAELPLEFSVSDNGPGIPDEIRVDIFEPFVTTRINGTGLGLTQVAKSVGRHGGVIECENAGQGAVFRLLLPAWNEAAAAATGTSNV